MLGMLFAGALATGVANNAVAQDIGNFSVYQRGFVRPIFMGADPGNPNRIFVAELRGLIHVIENGVKLPTPFLDIRDRLVQNMGLIGVAFPPDYATSRRFYVTYTPNDTNQPRICRFTTSDNPNVANPDEEMLLETGAGGGDHNSGWMEFGPDGYLYIARGDVGGDPQNIEHYQGKILRLDVSTPKGYAIPPTNPFVGQPGLDEIVAMGFRNPWRNGIDRETGDFYFADVGNVTMEEISFSTLADLPGKNFGWPCVEGTFCRVPAPPCTCDDPPMTGPIHSYTRAGQSAWIIGGTVYRGDAIPRWRGRYFFLDGGFERIWSFRAVNGVATDLMDHTTGLENGLTPPDFGMSLPISFGTDANNELYVLEFAGRILKITPAFDPADWDIDGTVNSADFFEFLGAFFDLNADITGDHQTTSADFFEYLGYFFKN